jgi:hypothetical protein
VLTSSVRGCKSCSQTTDPSRKGSAALQRYIHRNFLDRLEDESQTYAHTGNSSQACCTAAATVNHQDSGALSKRRGCWPHREIEVATGTYTHGAARHYGLSCGEGLANALQHNIGLGHGVHR